MADAGPGVASLGQQLLGMGLRQGTWFFAGEIDETLRQCWSGCRSEPGLRDKPIKQDALLMVLSQDCDIACRRDDEDPCIELAVFKRIKPKQRYAGNQFAHSVRKLQLSIGEQYYEAKVRETVRVPKQDLLACLKADRAPVPTTLTPEACRTLVIWRANRYQREALPDRFNMAFQPLLTQTLPKLEKLAADSNENSCSYIRALYVHLEHFNER